MGQGQGMVEERDTFEARLGHGSTKHAWGILKASEKKNSKDLGAGAWFMLGCVLLYHVV